MFLSYFHILEIQIKSHKLTAAAHLATEVYIWRLEVLEDGVTQWSSGKAKTESYADHLCFQVTLL